MVIHEAESVQFDLKTIEAATNNFSEHNKLGEGGFGEVYKVFTLYVHPTFFFCGETMK